MISTNSETSQLELYVRVQVQEPRRRKFGGINKESSFHLKEPNALAGKLVSRHMSSSRRRLPVRGVSFSNKMSPRCASLLGETMNPTVPRECALRYSRRVGSFLRSRLHEVVRSIRVRTISHSRGRFCIL